MGWWRYQFHAVLYVNRSKKFYKHKHSVDQLLWIFSEFIRSFLHVSGSFICHIQRKRRIIQHKHWWRNTDAVTISGVPQTWISGNLIVKSSLSISLPRLVTLYWSPCTKYSRENVIQGCFTARYGRLHTVRLYTISARLATTKVLFQCYKNFLLARVK